MAIARRAHQPHGGEGWDIAGTLQQWRSLDFSDILVRAERQGALRYVFPLQRDRSADEDFHNCAIQIDLQAAPDAAASAIISAALTGSVETWRYESNPARSVRV